MSYECSASRRERNEPATIQEDRSPWLIPAFIAHWPPAAGAPMERYAIPRGNAFPENSSPGANALLVRKFTSPLYGNSANKALANDWDDVLVVAGAIDGGSSAGTTAVSE